MMLDFQLADLPVYTYKSLTFFFFCCFIYAKTYLPTYVPFLYSIYVYTPLAVIDVVMRQPGM